MAGQGTEQAEGENSCRSHPAKLGTREVPIHAAQASTLRGVRAMAHRRCEQYPNGRIDESNCRVYCPRRFLIVILIAARCYASSCSGRTSPPES